MKRLARYLFTFCSAVSLMLCAATVALWVRSYFVNNCVGRQHFSPGVPNEDHCVLLQFDYGTATLGWGGDPVQNFSNVRWVWRRLPPYPRKVFRGDAPALLWAIGIGWSNERLQQFGYGTSGEVQMRLAFPASLSALATVVFLGLCHRFWRRSVQGVCATCGYDLRASPERCPECGTVTATNAAT